MAGGSKASRTSSSAPVLAQALLEPRETAGLAAFREAGFMQVGELAYLRADAATSTILMPPDVWHNLSWPDGVRVLRVVDLPEGQRDEAVVAALEATYEGTLDCPELCGLRSPEDVLASHKSVGDFNPALWWLVLLDGRPAGCSLFNVNPPLSSAELVYFGLAPSLRGRGLSSPLLSVSMSAACARTSGAPSGVRSVLCAVDLRNTPALRLYRRAGFERTQVRIPMICSLRAPRASA